MSKTWVDTHVNTMLYGIGHRQIVNYVIYTFADAFIGGNCGNIMCNFMIIRAWEGDCCPLSFCLVSNSRLYNFQ